MKKKSVTKLATAYSERVCDLQHESIDRLEVRKLVTRAYRSGYERARRDIEEKIAKAFIEATDGYFIICGTDYQGKVLEEFENRLIDNK